MNNHTHIKKWPPYNLTGANFFNLNGYYPLLFNLDKDKPTQRQIVFEMPPIASKLSIKNEYNP